MSGERALGKVLVTGAEGFLGQHLVNGLKRNGLQPLCWTRANGDLCNVPEVASMMGRELPDTVFHLAAEGVKTPGAVAPEIVQKNRAMIAGLVSNAKAGSRIISAGSMTEYGSSGLLSENLHCMPRTDYNRAKYQAGRDLIEAAVAKHVEAIHARLFHLYGPGEPAHRLFPTLLRQLTMGEPVSLSDGNQSRDYLHVKDAAQWLIKLASVPSYCIGSRGVMTVNVGTGIALKLRDVAFQISRAIGGDQSLLKFGTRSRSPADMDMLCADTRLLQMTIGATPPQRLHSTSDLMSLFAWERIDSI